MKRKFIKVLILLIILISVIGFIYYKFMDYNNPMYYVTVFQSGVYQNSVNAYDDAHTHNGIVIKDDDLYRVYIAVYQDDAIIEKIDNYYKKQGINCHLKQIRVDNKYIKILNKYESMLNISSDESIIPNLNSYLITSLESYL